MALETVVQQNSEKKQAKQYRLKCRRNSSFEIPDSDTVFYVYGIAAMHSYKNGKELESVFLTLVTKETAEEMWKIQREICSIMREINKEEYEFYISKRKEILEKKAAELSDERDFQEKPKLKKTSSKGNPLCDIDLENKLREDGLTNLEHYELEVLWKQEPGGKRFNAEVLPLEKQLRELVSRFPILDIGAKPREFIHCGLYNPLNLPKDTKVIGMSRFPLKIEVNRIVYSNGAVNLTYLHSSNGNRCFGVFSQLNMPDYLL